MNLVKMIINDETTILNKGSLNAINIVLCKTIIQL